MHLPRRVLAQCRSLKGCRRALRFHVRGGLSVADSPRISYGLQKICSLGLNEAHCSLGGLVALKHLERLSGAVLSALSALL